VRQRPAHGHLLAVNARHRLALWVRWLALTAAYPDRAYEAAVIGKARNGAAKGSTVSVARLPPRDPDAATRRSLALEHLTTLVDLFDRGMRAPVPVACMASAAYADAARNGRDAEAAGRGEWESGWAFDKEDKDLEHQLVLGGVRTFAELLEERPHDDEAGDGWDETDPTRFGRYARRLWDGLLVCEQVVDR
jgi:exodeoxyribonuclease V gamma subunit